MAQADCLFYPGGYCKQGAQCAPHAPPGTQDWELTHRDTNVDRLRIRHGTAAHFLDHLVGPQRQVLPSLPIQSAMQVVRTALEHAWSNLRAVVRNDALPTQDPYAKVTWVYLLDDDDLIGLWGLPRVAVYARACTDQAEYCRPNCAN